MAKTNGSRPQKLRNLLDHVVRELGGVKVVPLTEEEQAQVMAEEQARQAKAGRAEKFRQAGKRGPVPPERDGTSDPDRMATVLTS